LAATLMMTQAGMTNRIDRLEAAGLVERSLDPADRRSFHVALTDRGIEVIDAALTEHAGNLKRLSRGLTPEESDVLEGTWRLDAILMGLPGACRDEDFPQAREDGSRGATSIGSTGMKPARGRMCV
jgi:hypothetical protein